MRANRGLKIKETQYIFPPRSQDAIPLEDVCHFAGMGWEGQLKYNGSRCMTKIMPDRIELWNRHGERFRNYEAPSWLMDQLATLTDKLGLDPDSWTLLDGELLDQKHIAIKDTIVLWDVLVLNGEHLLGTTYGERYNFLKEKLAGDPAHTVPWMYTNPSKPNIHPPLDFGYKIADNILMPRNYAGNRSNATDNDGNPEGDAWTMLWDKVVMVANAPYTTGKPGDRNYVCHPVIEGLVIKDPDGELGAGFKEKNNSSWMIRSRVQTGRHIC